MSKAITGNSQIQGEESDRAKEGHTIEESEIGGAVVATFEKYNQLHHL